MHSNLPSTPQELITRTIESYCKHIDPVGGKQMLLMADDFVEWEAQGSILRDMRGREYIDGMTFGGVFGLGHRHPRIIAAVKEQLDRMPLSSRLGFNRPLAELGRLLAEITPDPLQYSFISSSGTEAIEVALKLARVTTGRPGIVSAQNAYHGMSIACSSVGGIEYWHQGIAPLLQGCQHVPFGDLAALRDIADTSTAAIILEPVQANAGCLVPPDGYLAGVRELCTERGILLIIDEIQTGFGRTGRMFAIEHDGIVPDILCLGKFLGGGVMAIGATVYTPQVAQAISDKPLFNNTTFGGNPLACSAAVAAIQTVLEEGLVERAAALGKQLEEGLDRLIERHPQVLAGQRGRGLMRSFVVQSIPHAITVAVELLQTHRLLLLSPVHSPTMFRVNPALVVEPAFIEQILETIDKVCCTVGALSIDEMVARFAALQAKLASLG